MRGGTLEALGPALDPRIVVIKSKLGTSLRRSSYPKPYWPAPIISDPLQR